MVQTLRKPEIIDIARREGKVTVDQLVEHFQVTPQTIRRDLTELADAGDLERVHGGAILPSNTSNIGYVDRRELNQPQKFDIARECVQHIPNDCSLFLNIGTTTEAVAAELFNHSGLLVVTNNINIANILSDHPSVEVVVTGGNLRPSDGGLIGALARETISQFRFDLAVIGCSALHMEGEILDFDIREVGVSKAIIRRSDKVILAADSSKFERKAPIQIATLSEIDTFITEKTPPTASVELCKRSATQIILAESTHPTRTAKTATSATQN
ncbi:glycerol-3-phosphate regulon repressor [Actibacterium atlanticum]|uniref:Glycerol-3-phosphate regulon repressor n=1 Tax=Actibacterium atlanticum TaxID=1461693 RepID=A0A058ZLE0_9RHOB|nr:DeoR/GlpR family DNA-binding transcription regulator [Actibacterium atlanticum]KCV82439.1 glycerol-3-phosphate regulon repressor [Actibacterium atlanticum]